MGYSIAIRCRSPESKRRMLAFMEAHYRTWPVVSGDEAPIYASPPTDDLDYDRAKSAIGINHKACGDWEREYAYSIIRWMALRVGTRKTQFSNEVTTKHPRHFWVYDGHESIPIITATRVPERLTPYKTDKLGMRLNPATMALSSVLMFEDDVDFRGAYEQARKEAGEMDDGFVRRVHAAMYANPSIKKVVDHKLGVMCTELARLDRLWTIQSVIKP